MWVHLDLIEEGLWTIVISKQKQNMKKYLSCHVISLGAGDNDTSTSVLADLEEEQNILMVDPAPVSGTRSRKWYLNQYNEEATIKSFHGSSTLFISI